MIKCPFCTSEIIPNANPGEYAILGICSSCMNPILLRENNNGCEAARPKGVQDVRQIAAEESIGGILFTLLPQAIENLPVLPEIAQRIMKLLREPNTELQNIADLINGDQVIALRILKLANSPVYGGLTEIKDLRSACARLGMRVIANAVQTIANGRLYQTSDPGLRTIMEDLWRHAVASAHCASEIASMMAEPSTDVYFVAGLIHDVGKVLLLDVIGNHSADIMKTLRESPELFREVMKQYHSLVGLHITHHWKLPPEFAIAAFCHENPDVTPHDYWQPLVNTVTLASAISNASSFGDGDPPPSLLSMPATKYLGLNDIKLATLRIELEDKVTPLLELLEQNQAA